MQHDGQSGGRGLVGSREGGTRKRRAGAEDVEIGRKIRALRLERGLSQSTLADGIGLTFQQVQKYEKGTNRVSAGRLQKIAGSVCSGCYALKGRYVFPAVQRALYRRLEAIARPHWAEVMAELIRRKSKRAPYFRWHDSGDIQSLEHMRAIARVAELTPDVSHWIPSREYRLVRQWLELEPKPPANLNIRLSAHMLGGRAPRFPGLRVTVSTVSKGEPPKGAYRCPAPSQGNVCGSCRACWDPSVKHVDYHYH